MSLLENAERFWRILRDGNFSGFRLEDRTPHAEEIADIEILKKIEPFTQIVLSQINLESFELIPERGENRFTVPPDGHDPARDRDRFLAYAQDVKTILTLPE